MYSICTYAGGITYNDLNIATRTLMEIIKMEELKKKTTTKVTESIISSAKNLLLVPNDNCNLTCLVTNLVTASQHILLSMQKCKLLSSKEKKLWKCFHCFPISEGLKMYQSCVFRPLNGTFSSIATMPNCQCSLNSDVQEISDWYCRFYCLVHAAVQRMTQVGPG